MDDMQEHLKLTLTFRVTDAERDPDHPYVIVSNTTTATDDQASQTEARPEHAPPGVEKRRYTDTDTDTGTGTDNPAATSNNDNNNASRAEKDEEEEAEAEGNAPAKKKCKA